MAWVYVGSATIGPDSGVVTVGAITVPTYGGVQLKVGNATQTPFPFGFCLLSYRSTYGLELGTIRVWPKPELVSYALGRGLTVDDNNGVIQVEPRTWNLRWVRAGFSLSFDVLADLASDLPADRVLPDGYATVSGGELSLTPAGGQGRLTF